MRIYWEAAENTENVSRIASTERSLQDYWEFTEDLLSIYWESTEKQRSLCRIVMQWILGVLFKNQRMSIVYVLPSSSSIRVYFSSRWQRNSMHFWNWHVPRELIFPVHIVCSHIDKRDLSVRNRSRVLFSFLVISCCFLGHFSNPRRNGRWRKKEEQQLQNVYFSSHLF